MQLWRKLVNRPFAQRGSAVGRIVIGALLALVVLAGCARGAGRHESWPGMTLVDGTIYASNLENVVALESETGARYWSFPGDSEEDFGPFYTPPAYVEEYGAHGMLLIAGFEDRNVYALSLGASPETAPAELWRFSGAEGQYVGGGAVADGKYIIGNGDGNVYALNLENGDLAWTFTTEDRVWATPVVSGNEVYIASLDHNLYAVDLETGDELWRLEFDGALSATPVLADDHLWIGDFTSNLYEIDLAAQEVSWQFEARDWIWATPLYDDGTLYFSDVGGNVYALDAESHEMRWGEPTSVGDIVHGRAALNADGSILFVPGFEKGQIHALDVDTGSEISWGTVQENPGRLPGNLVSDAERLYTMPILIETRVQAFGLENGTLIWRYPVGE